MKILIIFFLLLLVEQETIKAQTAEGNNPGFSYFLADLSYISDAVFMGRRDSIKAPYAYASLGYFDRSGFYGNASASYLVSSGEERIDLFLITAGYLLTGEHLSAGLSGTKYFFDEESYNVQSEIEGDITAMVGYDFDFIELGFSAAGYFSSGSSVDVVAALRLERIFYAMNRRLIINPAVLLGAGTRHFYEEYYNTSRMGNRKGGGNGQQGPGSGPGGTGMMQIENKDLALSEASEFTVLNVEARLPFQFYYRSFIFSFTPVMAFPQAPATITAENVVYREHLDSVFYWSAGISYWIKTKK